MSETVQEVQIVKAGYSSPQRPVGMILKGQQAQGKVEVHKRPPALKEVAVHGPFLLHTDLLVRTAHEVTRFFNEYGISFCSENQTQVMTQEVNARLSELFQSWYEWAGLELEQRFEFKHTPEQAIEVK